MNRLKKYVAAAGLAIVATGATTAASNAMPLVNVTQPAAPALVEHVRWGCGIGWHPNHWGRCVPNRVIVRPLIIAPGIHVLHPYHRWHRWHR